MTCPRLLRALAPALALGASLAAQPVDPRALPSLDVRWRRDFRADQAALRDGVLYLAGTGEAMAVDPMSGAALWQQTYGDGRGSARQLLEYGRERNPLLALLPGRLALALGDTVYLVDPRTGVATATSPLGGTVNAIAGPPLVAVVSGIPNNQVVRLDEKTGAIVSRGPTLDLVYDIALEGDTLVVLTNEEPQLVGLRASDLAPIWTRKVRTWQPLEVLPGRVYAEVGDDADPDFVPVDLDTGKLGEPLPRRAPRRPSEFLLRRDGLTWELQVIAPHRADDVVLRRNDVATGRTLWQTRLPGLVTAWVQDGDTLYLQCKPESGRGLLILLSYATGAVMQTAYSFQDVSKLLKSGELLIALCEGEGVAAFSSSHFGPPEAAFLPVPDEVQRLLHEWKGGLSTDWIAQLRSLGPAALPLVTEALPDLLERGLFDMALEVVDGARYREAAPVLARILENPPERWFGSECGNQDDQLVMTSQALARLGGEATIPTLKALVADERMCPVQTRGVMVALASIGAPEARAAVDTWTSRHPSRNAWFEPPVPTLLDLAGVPMTEEERNRLLGQRDYRPFAERERMRGDVGYDALSEIRIEPARSGDTFAEAPRALLPEERRYTLSRFSGPLDAVGYSVIVRRVGDRWYVVDWRLGWVS